MSRILVADDSELSRELVHEILAGTGCEVIDATDGLEALQKMRAERPDLVLLDIRMPVLDGLAVIAEVRRDPGLAGLRVLALTAYAMDKDRDAALAAGFDGYITKPVEAARLRREAGLPPGPTTSRSARAGT